MTETAELHASDVDFTVTGFRAPGPVSPNGRAKLPAAPEMGSDTGRGSTVNLNAAAEIPNDQGRFTSAMLHTVRMLANADVATSSPWNLVLLKRADRRGRIRVSRIRRDKCKPVRAVSASANPAGARSERATTA
ncbi:hypothetical protein [Streptomyces sp. SAS_275]|uniref:hypothetical protein n=1 Tax=Streptomyces sp. SAS_275 TaxID=3412746 RepID=UPI00403D0D5D